jgi:hypothetical protein
MNRWRVKGRKEAFRSVHTTIAVTPPGSARAQGSNAPLQPRFPYADAFGDETARASWGEVVDTPKKPQTSDEQEVLDTPVPAPSPAVPARSPFRPLSRRRRQAQEPAPPAAVERPSTSLVFDASPTTIAAALAKAGASPDEPSLAWRPGHTSDGDADVDEDGAAGTASPR